MSKKIFYILFSAVFALISHQSVAQIIDTQIMDAKISFYNSGGSYHGSLKVYLTSSQDLQSLEIKIGSQNDQSDLVNQNINFNSLPSGSSLEENVATIDLGIIANVSDYFVKAKVNLADNTNRVIEFHYSEN